MVRICTCGHPENHHEGVRPYPGKCGLGCTCEVFEEHTLEMRQVEALERIAVELAAIRSLMQGWDHNGAAVDVALYGGVISTEER